MSDPVEGKECPTGSWPVRSGVQGMDFISERKRRGLPVVVVVMKVPFVSEHSELGLVLIRKDISYHRKRVVTSGAKVPLSWWDDFVEQIV